MTPRYRSVSTGPNGPPDPPEFTASHGAPHRRRPGQFEHAGAVRLASELGVVVVSVDYRLAPETPFPGPLEDVYAGLVWMSAQAGELGIDPRRIAIHGTSAGGGLCAGLALLARDRGGPHIAFQFLSVPELDDRLTSPSMTAFTDTPFWNRPRAVLSWDCYLGPGRAGSDDVPVYAAPARATVLADAARIRLGDALRPAARRGCRLRPGHARRRGQRRIAFVPGISTARLSSTPRRSRGGEQAEGVAVLRRALTL